MSQAFLEQLDATAQRLRGVAQQTTLRASTAAVIALVVGLILVDRFGRFEDVGMRWLSTVVLVAASAVLVWRFAQRNRPADATRLGVAQRLQRLRPETGSRLASAVEFAESDADDATAGSAELRRAVVLETATGADSLPYAEVVDAGPLRRATRALAASAAVVALFAVVSGPTLAQGLVRLAMPWAHSPWPREVALRLVDPPAKLPRGETFEAIAVNTQGAIPADTRVEFRFEGLEGSAARSESSTVQLVGDQAVATRPAVERSFSYRFVGGDDDTMAWTSLEVIDPPQASELTVAITPPAYSGLPFSESAGPLRVLAGSRLGLSGEADKAVTEAVLALPGDVTLPLGFSTDASPTTFTLSEGKWAATPSDSAAATYEVRLTGKSGVTGIVGPHRYEVVADKPPKVEWRSAEGEGFVTARALVAVAGDVTEDLATRRVELEWSASSSDATDGEANAEPARVAIEDFGPEPPPRMTLGREERRAVAFDWDLEPLGLQEGAGLSFDLVATDYQPAEGRTDTPRRLVIVSDEEFLSRLAEQQSRLLGQVQQALSSQRDASDATGQLRADTRNADSVRRKELDRLTTIELLQLETSNTVADPVVGAGVLAGRLLDDLRRSRLEEPDLRAQLSAARDGLAKLGREELPAARGGLADARRAGQRAARNANDPQPTAEFGERLDEASAAQAEAIERLEQIADTLTSWADYQRFAAEAEALERLERELAAEAQREAAASAAGLPDTAAREKLVLRQAEATRRFDKLSQAMRRLLRTQEGVPSDQRTAAADAVGDALAEADAADVAGRLRDASRSLALERLGGASQSQTEAADGLRSMLEALRQRTTNDPEELARRLKEEKRRLAEVQEQVDRLRREPNPRRAEAGRQQAASRASRLGRRLERLTASQAAASTEQGAQQTSGSPPQASQQGDGQPPRGAREQLADAQQSFEQAQRDIDQRIRELENQQTQRLLEQLAQRIGGYIQRQEVVLDETLGLRSELEASARPETAKIERRAAELADIERDLADESGEFAERLAKRAVFELALRGAADQMCAAARRLDESLVDRPTQRAESNALARLRHIQEVLRQNQQLNENQGPQGGGGGGGGEHPPPSPIDVAELKMLRLMQLEVLSETDAYEADTAAARRRGERLPLDWPETGRELADRQRRLAELTVELAERTTDPEASDEER